MSSTATVSPSPPTVKPNVCCGTCGDTHIHRNHGGYLWLLCGCAGRLPLAAAAIKALQVANLNRDVEASRAAMQLVYSKRKLLGDDIRNVLHRSCDTHEADWMDDENHRLFGPAYVEDLRFALEFGPDNDRGSLVVLDLTETPSPITKLADLGALLAGRKQEVAA